MIPRVYTETKRNNSCSRTVEYFKKLFLLNVISYDPKTPFFNSIAFRAYLDYNDLSQLLMLIIFQLVRILLSLPSHSLEIIKRHPLGVHFFRYHAFTSEIFDTYFLILVGINRHQLRFYLGAQLAAHRLHHPDYRVPLRVHQGIENAAKSVLRGQRSPYEQSSDQNLVLFRRKTFSNCDSHNFCHKIRLQKGANWNRVQISQLLQPKVRMLFQLRQQSLGISANCSSLVLYLLWLPFPEIGVQQKFLNFHF